MSTRPDIRCTGPYERLNPGLGWNVGTPERILNGVHHAADGRPFRVL